MDTSDLCWVSVTATVTVTGYLSTLGYWVKEGLDGLPSCLSSFMRCCYNKYSVTVTVTMTVTVTVTVTMTVTVTVTVTIIARQQSR
jgi:hypothetical protein